MPEPTGIKLTRAEAANIGLVLPDGAIGVTLYGAAINMGVDANQHAVVTHNALQWQAEATRLNTLVHALRRELEQAKSMSGQTVIQSLLTTLEHCEPFVRSSRNNFVGQRVDVMLDELLVTKSAALTALKYIT